MSNLSSGKRQLLWRRTILVGLTGFVIAFGSGCSHKDANGGGPEVLEKKFPGGGAQSSGGAKDPTK